MPQFRQVWRASLVFWILSSLLVFAPVAGADGQYDDTGVVKYTDNYPLLDSTFSTLAGTRTETGGCAFKFPPLTRATADSGPLEMRQVETDFRTCTTVLETGVPGRGRTHSEGGSGVTSTQPATGAAGESGPSTAVTNKTVRFKVTWEDTFDLDVNWLRSNITYSTNATCVTSATGSSTDYYLTLTGWNRQWRNTYINPAQCSYRKVWADAQYRNIPFCAPTTVYTDYRAVTIYVTAYAYSGWVDSTWATERPFSDPACPNLHFKQGFD